MDGKRLLIMLLTYITIVMVVAIFLVVLAFGEGDEIVDGVVTNVDVVEPKEMGL